MILRFFILLSIFGAFFASSSLVVKPGPQYPPTKGEVWPKPQHKVTSDTYYKFISSVFKVKILGQTCAMLTNAIERYTFIVRDMNRTARRMVERGSQTQYFVVPRNKKDEMLAGIIHELHIDLTSPCEEYPYFKMDESYNLTIASNTKLSSASIWGILRGLETWSQLFYISENANDILINATEIYDFPRYAHRGLLLDTSRHFISMSKILKTLDAMAINKMNVLHWHIVDDQSFPYQSEKFPNLSRLGAYHPTLVYTKSDIQMVVNYAKERGIRVLPEFDVPGHTSSWGVAYPNILTKCYNGDEFVGLGPMNPLQNTTYKLLQDLFREIQEWFPDKYFHIGGDEVSLDCWNSNPDIQEYMKQHHMDSPSKLHALFMETVIPLLGERSRPIVWQEVFDEQVPLSSDTLVQVWKGNEASEMINILAAGHQVLYSSAWYLDHLKSGGDWTDMYLADPRRMVQKLRRGVNVENIVGGEACMWGEVVNDYNVISRVWPRASAVAEKLWSAETYDVPKEVYSRLEEHACRMNRRGVHAQPPSGPGYCVGVA